MWLVENVTTVKSPVDRFIHDLNKVKTLTISSDLSIEVWSQKLFSKRKHMWVYLKVIAKPPLHLACIFRVWVQSMSKWNSDWQMGLFPGFWPSHHFLLCLTSNLSQMVQDLEPWVLLCFPTEWFDLVCFFVWPLSKVERCFHNVAGLYSFFVPWQTRDRVGGWRLKFSHPIPIPARKKKKRWKLDRDVCLGDETRYLFGGAAWCLNFKGVC